MLFCSLIELFFSILFYNMRIAWMYRMDMMVKCARGRAWLLILPKQQKFSVTLLNFEIVQKKKTEHWRIDNAIHTKRSIELLLPRQSFTCLDPFCSMVCMFVICLYPSFLSLFQNVASGSGDFTPPDFWFVRIWLIIFMMCLSPHLCTF